MGQKRAHNIRIRRSEMTKYNVKVWSAFDVEAEDETEAVEQAANQVSEMGISDWDYEAEPVKALLKTDTKQGSS